MEKNNVDMQISRMLYVSGYLHIHINCSHLNKKNIKCIYTTAANRSTEYAFCINKSEKMH